MNHGELVRPWPLIAGVGPTMVERSGRYSSTCTARSYCRSRSIVWATAGHCCVPQAVAKLCDAGFEARIRLTWNARFLKLSNG